MKIKIHFTNYSNSSSKQNRATHDTQSYFKRKILKLIGNLKVDVAV